MRPATASALVLLAVVISCAYGTVHRPGAGIRPQPPGASGLPPRLPSRPVQRPQGYTSASKTVYPGGAVGFKQQSMAVGPGGSSSSSSSTIMKSPGGISPLQPGISAPGMPRPPAPIG